MAEAGQLVPLAEQIEAIQEAWHDRTQKPRNPLTFLALVKVDNADMSQYAFWCEKVRERNFSLLK